MSAGVAQLREELFEVPLVRGAVSCGVWVRSLLHHLRGRRYHEACDLCWLGRVSRVPLLKTVADRYVVHLIKDVKRGGGNELLRAFLRSDAAAAVKEQYATGNAGGLDIYRDLIILKEPRSDEKGVLLIKYTPTFDAFLAMFDLEAVQDRYYIVLEPSWAGYCDPSILMFIADSHPVWVQCFTEEDYAFIDSFKSNLVPVRLGPADWINPQRFPDGILVEKKYDIVMVANWGRHKQHKQLFRALREMTGRELDVLLIGFEWGGRTRQDLLAEAQGLPRSVRLHIKEDVPHEMVGEYISQSKMLVFLSKKEGDNKALVEGMFCNVPAIVYSETIGGAKNRINQETGILSSYADLGGRIVYMLDHYQEFAPRAWALCHTGCTAATHILNAALERVAREKGDAYLSRISEKANSPNLVYVHAEDERKFAAGYELLRTIRRGHRGSGD